MPGLLAVPADSLRGQSLGAAKGTENYWVPRAAITKIPETQWPKYQVVIFHASAGWEVQDQGAGRFGSGDSPLPESGTAVLQLCPPVGRGERAH